jgi:hypothetical protein
MLPSCGTMYRHDYIKRLIEQLGSALAAAVGRRQAGDTEQAYTEVRLAYAALDINPLLLRSMDGASLARSLKEPRLMRLVARLLAEEAHLLELRADLRAAYAQRRRAVALLREANAADASGGGDSDDAADASRLLASLEAELLPYRS